MSTSTAAPSPVFAAGSLGYFRATGHDLPARITTEAELAAFLRSEAERWRAQPGTRARLLAILAGVAPTTYRVERTGADSWRIDGKPCEGITAALAACCERDEAAGCTWDLSLPGACRDGLEALRIGESKVVDVSELLDEEDADDA